MTDKKITKGEEPMSFGVFNPVGYVVLAIGAAARAAHARESLLAAGYKEGEQFLLYTADEVLAATEATFPKRSVLSWLGDERDAAEQHRALAQQGCSFLVVHAPHDDETQRVLQVVGLDDLRLAQKYGRATIRDLI